MGDTMMADLAAAWLALWNGDLGRLGAVVAEDLVTHAVPPGSESLEELRGRQVLAEWIRQTHECFTERTTYEVGPIVQDPYIVVRWHSTGAYKGGLPGVPPEAAGRAIDFRGIDILRVERERVVEFWISADTPVLMRQLGAGAPG